MTKLKVYNFKLNKFRILKLIGIVLGIVFLIIYFVHANSQKNIEIMLEKNIIERAITSVPYQTIEKFMEQSLAIAKINNDQKNINMYMSVKNVFKYELSALNKILDSNVQNINIEDLEVEDRTELLEYEKVDTEVLDSGIKDVATNKLAKVDIKNTSSYKITDKMLEKANNDNHVYSRNVFIYHTHTCESYTQTPNYEYVKSGNYRTTDLNYSVARVGDELEKHLLNFGFNVIHNKSYHDFPAYSGSYTNSYGTAEKILKENPEYEIVIDIHRDAIGSDSKYAPMVKIGDEKVAQLMFVIGTNAGGLEHSNWEQNLSYAIKVQRKANELYPGLFKAIRISDSRYNQNLARGATIIEAGATGNTMEQVLASMKYLSIVLDAAI